MAPNEFSQTQLLLPERRGPGSFILRRLLINGFARLSSPFLYWLKAAGTARLTGARTPTVPRLCRAAAESCLPRLPSRPRDSILAIARHLNFQRPIRQPRDPARKRVLPLSVHVFFLLVMHWICSADVRHRLVLSTIHRVRAAQ